MNSRTAWKRPSSAFPVNELFAPYEATPYKALELVAKRLKLGPTDIVVDIGCGKGRAICWFARLPIKGCVGIEFDADLAEIARQNARSLRGRKAPIEVHCIDARAASYTGATVIFMYNPFRAPIMREVLERIDCGRVGSPVTVIYVNPKEELTLKSCDWLEPVEEFRVPYDLSNLSVQIWRSR